MKTRTTTTIVLFLLAILLTGCSFSVTTANISSLTFGKDEKATPPTTTFNVGEKVYAVATVSNSISKQKLRFNVLYENVQGKNKGEVAGTKDLEMPGGGTGNFFFSTPFPGDYRVDVSLIDESGKEIDKKSGTVTVKGQPAAPAETNKGDDAGHDSESNTTEEKPNDH